MDYKIATKALSNRLKKILSKLIHPNQVGYVQGRNITENVRTIQDLLMYTKTNNIPGYLISIDFQKAFDSLEWTFLDSTLDKFNFGPSFKHWVKTFYTDISSSVINNGHTSRYFALKRGVRQGDPLSPYLFILAGEILSNAIRQNKEIKGININDKEIKILQYADDTSGILKNEKSAKSFLKEVELYGSYSGLKLNKEKTEGFRLGPNHNINNTNQFGISWSQTPIRLLGIFFSYDEEASNKCNFEKKIQDAKSVINLWKMRDLTTIGRIQIIKTYIISKFMYTCSVIHMPEMYTKEINKLIFTFIWKGGRDKVKRSIMIGNKQKGGLRAPDIDLMTEASRINWIKRYLSPPGNAQTWKYMVKSLFQQDGINLDVLLQSNFDIAQLKLTVPKFYIEMLKTWSKVSDTEPLEKKVFLWYNKVITRDKKPIYYEEFYHLGIKYVTDLFYVDKKAIPFKVWVDKGLPPSQFMNWAGLISAASKFKGIIDEWTPSDSLTYFIKSNEAYTCTLDILTSRKLYDLLVICKYGVNVDAPNVVKYVELNDLNQSWDQIFEIAHSSIDVKTRDFQFRFLHDILCNNYWLEKWKITDDSSCTFCKRNVENIGHLFWHCNIVKHFWNRFNQTFSDKVDGLPLTMIMVFLGTSNKLICTLIFVAKRYIYECRMKEQIPFFPMLVNKINYVQKIEFQIAKNNNCTDRWFEKWEPML